MPVERQSARTSTGLLSWLLSRILATVARASATRRSAPRGEPTEPLRNR